LSMIILKPLLYMGLAISIVVKDYAVDSFGYYNNILFCCKEII
jgi:hypothetical protein